MSNWKVLAGRMRDAWQEYPALRRRVSAVPAGPPIFLTGTHRSGTTWLAKMLAASGIWYIHEPFSPKKGRWSRSFQFREVEHPDPMVDGFFREILGGGFRNALNLPNSDHPLMPARLFPPPFQRLLVKDPLACLLTAYLTRRFQLQTLILFRHPAGFAASVQRLGWPRGAFLRQFLHDQPLMRAHLEPHRDILQRFVDEDSLLSAAALHGALTSVLWQFAEQGVGSKVIFEDVCSDPIEQLKQLFARLGLPYGPEVEREHQVACLGSERPVADYHPHAVARNSLAMARSWAKQLDRSEADAVREVWQGFSIPLYLRDDEWQVES